MINLLPYEESKQTRAARTNLIILRYIIFLGLAIGFLVLACVTTYLLILFIHSQDKKLSEINSAVSTSNVSTANSPDAVNTNLVTAKSILDQRVSYSSILSGISSALPAGTVLESLSLDDANLAAPVNLKIYSLTADSEQKIKEGFQQSPLFSNYLFVSNENNQGDKSGYNNIINVSININMAAAK